MSQMSFSDIEYAGKRKQTRRKRFLAEMDQVVPWSGLVALIEPHYPRAGGGRKPYPLETMLRIHLLQNWFSLSDPAMEEALYEITSMRQFARLTLSAPIPEDTTIMNFRHLLEKLQLAADILETIIAYLRDKGLLLRQGTIVDATIIHAPSSTKNKEGKRDPEMHQTKKGNPYYIRRLGSETGLFEQKWKVFFRSSLSLCKTLPQVTGNSLASDHREEEIARAPNQRKYEPVAPNETCLDTAEILAEDEVDSPGVLQLTTHL